MNILKIEIEGQKSKIAQTMIIAITKPCKINPQMLICVNKIIATNKTIAIKTRCTRSAHILSPFGRVYKVYSINKAISRRSFIKID